MTNASGRLTGMVSLDDIVIRGMEMGGVSPGQIVGTLRVVYERRPAVIEPVPVPAGV